MLGVSVSGAPFLEGRDTCATDDLNFPSGGMHGYNTVYWGFLPDEGDSGGTKTHMSTINGNTGKQASTYGWYSQITTLPYDGSQLLDSDLMNDVVSSGAVFVPAIMPTNVKFADITEDVGTQIAEVLEQYTSKNVEVWLRFAHEVNCYVSAACSGQSSPIYAGRSQAEYITAWQNVHAAIASNPKIFMFWSPNSDSPSDLSGWWPGANYVDIVGMDVYPDSSQSPTFASVYGPFYDTFAAGYNKHFAIGETRSKEGDVGSKEAWVKQLADTDVSAYPCYISATWFEYQKGSQDFRIIQGQSAATIQETLSNFA
ncbi:hypothetical protein MMC28_004815 [Mycoblastus sanguinarius]|nr:hypothetical protein [Mycoblastus sanguinarius]